MKGRFRRIIGGLAVAGLLGNGGCAVLTDVFNPSAILGLGFDPVTVFPSQGTVIVSFTNQTEALATFSFVEAGNANDVVRTGRTGQIRVEPGEVGNAVLQCPRQLITPGILLPDGDIDQTAVVVEDNDAGTAVAYDGVAIVSPRMFVCGDVIAFTLTETAEGFALTVRVIPGGR